MKPKITIFLILLISIITLTSATVKATDVYSVSYINNTDGKTYIYTSNNGINYTRNTQIDGNTLYYGAGSTANIENIKIYDITKDIDRIIKANDIFSSIDNYSTSQSTGYTNLQSIKSNENGTLYCFHDTHAVSNIRLQEKFYCGNNNNVWTPTGINATAYYQVNDYDMSDNGQYITLGASYSTNNGYAYVSNDSGLTFTVKAVSTTNDNINAVGVSSTGQHQLIAFKELVSGGYPTILWKSNDYGQTWYNITSYYTGVNPTAITISTDGTKMYYLDSELNNTYGTNKVLYYTLNNGSTWSSIPNVTSYYLTKDFTKILLHNFTDNYIYVGNNVTTLNKTDLTIPYTSALVSTRNSIDEDVVLNKSATTTTANYTITQYACTNTNFTSIGTNNLCNGNFVQYISGPLAGTNVCEPLVYGTNANITCTFNCTYYGEDIGGFCNENSSITLGNGSTTINGTWEFSDNQCVIANGVEYVCTSSIFLDNGVYCSLTPGNLQACPKYCLTHIINQNDSTYEYFGLGHTCTEINDNANIFGQVLKCTFNWINPATWINAILTQNTVGFKSCTLNGFAYIPTNKCNDNLESIYEYYQSHTNDTFYVEGQCRNETCESTCNPSTPKACENLIQTKTCVAYPDGCYRYNYTTCTSGTTCNAGICGIPVNNQTGGMHGDANCDSTNFLNACNLSNQNIFLIVFIVIVISIVGAVFLGYTAGHTSLGLYLGIILAVFELILFTLLKWIPVWILILLTIVSIGLTVFVSFRGRDSDG